MTNPLLTFQNYPFIPFSLIQPEHIQPAVTTLLDKNRQQIQNLLKENVGQYTWENLIWPLEIMEGELEDVCSTLSHLNAVLSEPTLHEAYQQALSALALYHSEIKQNEELYQAVASIVEEDITKRKVLENMLQDFRLSGCRLSNANKEELKLLEVKLAQLENDFEHNVLASTDNWSLLITEAGQLEGLPDHIVEIAALKASSNNKVGWLLTLDFPCYHAVMVHGKDRKIRELLYKAYNTRATHHMPHDPKWDNSRLMLEIIKVRQHLSKLLGFNTYAEYALEKRMLKTPKAVLAFLEDMLQRVKTTASKDIEEIKQFAKQEYQLEDLQVWDIAYISEKLLQKNYNFSEEMLKEYFPEDKVLEGLFSITQQLYGIQIKEIKDFDKWHPSVRLFEVYDEHHTIRGKFYLDLYTRANKRGGAWVSNAKVRMKYPNGQLQLPVVYLITNFSKLEGKATLLTHDEVTTLFHEFGHCVHHLFTVINYPSISSGNGVVWDAIELPSQLMENWCWEKEAISLFAKHFKEQTLLPEALFLKMIHTRNFQIGLKLIRQLEFALFDFELHHTEFKEKPDFIQEILTQVRERTAVFPISPFNQFQNSFIHIFAGGYAAGYYSYLWSEVLAADVYELFKENNNIFDKKVAKRYLSTLLEPGGSKDFMELFTTFRGRAPTTDAFLEKLSLNKA